MGRRFVLVVVVVATLTTAYIYALRARHRRAIRETEQWMYDVESHR